MFTLISDIFSAVTEWMKQAKNYNHSTNRCLTGNSCDSYKRVISDQTTHIGCAYHKCENFGPWENNLVVCNYAPSLICGRPYTDGTNGRCKEKSRH
ncbi:unnamed protein product [Heterobilharzia americana]|nr:unnamed protein product [Heterobilharzia americana]